MTIPEIRREMRMLACEHGLPRLLELAAELRRRSSHRAPDTSEPMTPALAREIHLTAFNCPDLTQAEIGQIHGVNQGRVSEVLRGRRT